MRIALALAFALAACSSKEPRPDAPAPPPKEGPVATPPDAEAPPAPELGTYEGRLDIDRIPGGKKLQAVWLHVDGEDNPWIVKYRPDPRYFPFIEKRVRVRGRTYRPDSHHQQVGALHFEIADIELAEGESPHVPVPTALPAPPRIATGAALDARQGWLRLFGTLEKVDRESDWRGKATIRLPDGTPVVVTCSPKTFEPLIGKQVSVVGHTAGPNAKGWRASGRAICEGDVPRCGMSGHARVKKASPSHRPPAKGDTPWGALGTRVTVEGAALDLKLGAVVDTPEGHLWIDGLSGWPDGLYKAGARVRVEGVLVQRGDLPVFVERKGEPIKAGIPVPAGTDLDQARQRVVLEDAKWSVVGGR